MELLQATLRVTEQEYRDNGQVTWQTFYADQDTHQKKVVTLTESDFTNGTIRVRKPCLLLLTENVSFNPNRPTPNGDGTLDLNRAIDWMPFPGQPNADDYLSGDAAKGYRLGFFAAIAIETTRVILDLGGHTLSQHKEHALMQRFFSCIELADQPFRSSQGPADFGASLSSATMSWVKNGCIGLSSHHAIHGNSCKDIWLSDLVFKNQEVASISINGGKGILVERCEDRGRRTGIPVLGAWSALRFATLFAPHLSSLDSYSTYITTPLDNALEAVKRVFDSIIVHNDGVLDVEGDNSDLAFLKNTTGLLDGPGYGMVFHPEGVAIGPFQMSPGHQTGSIWIKDTIISNVINSSLEIPSLSKADGTGNQVDTVGSVIQVLNGLMDEDGHYVPSILSALQFGLASLKAANPDSSSHFGTLSIDSNLLEWSQDPSIALTLNETGTEASLTNGTTYKVRYNGDSMHHVLKGVLGLRMEGATDISLTNVCVKDIVTEGVLGRSVYSNENDGGHEGQKGMVGYWGTVSHGVRISGSSSISLKNVSVDSVSSTNGPAYGIAVHSSSGATLSTILVERVEGGSSGSFSLDDTDGRPNPLPVANGVVVTTTPFCKLNSVQSSTVSQASTLSLPEPIHLSLENVQKLL